MGLFGFGSKKSAIHILIDVGSASVGGAYVHFKTGQLPTIHYDVRINTDAREGEDQQASMLRTLQEVTELLVKRARRPYIAQWGMRMPIRSSYRSRHLGRKRACA